METILIILVAIIGIVGVVALLLLYNTFSWGYVCFKFWYWFILPIFPDLPQLNFWQCIGLMSFIALFRNQYSSSASSSKKDEEKTAGEKYGALISVLATPWVILLIAACFKNFIL